MRVLAPRASANESDARKIAPDNLGHRTRRRCIKPATGIADNARTDRIGEPSFATSPQPAVSNHRLVESLKRLNCRHPPEVDMLKAISTLAATSLLWTAIAVQVSGAWTLTFDPDFSGTHGTSAECTFVQKAEALTGTCGNSAPITGEIKGMTVRFDVKTGLKNEYTATFQGVLDESTSTIAGSWTLADETGNRDGKFTLKKH